MKRLLIILLLISTVCFADVQTVRIDTSSYDNDDVSLITAAARSMVQRANNGVYVRVSNQDGILTADMPDGLKLNRIIDSDSLLVEINAIQEQNAINTAIMEADNLEKENAVKQKLGNLSEDDIKALRRLLEEVE